ncbi:agmatinase [Actinokineospora sp. PR83]|uniref:agmatinase n=1 Tax=Actinokineospora sp. PR83 TaxID=2884908 RepID=UPI0027DFCC7E|nr:agmatinase [Actinokineospora sp. PR83]MCG8914440.1 agmatinase [Actinokineospora sp. PR83]
MTDPFPEFVAPYSPEFVEPAGSRSSFCGIPVRGVQDVRDGDVVIIGAPFDWGTSFRAGARFGPRFIRDADYLEASGTRPHLAAGVDPLVDLSVVDAGDNPMVRGYMDESLDAIESYVHEIVRRGGTPVVLGGDHTITLPNAKAVARHRGNGRFAVVHFDAHPDTGVYTRPEMLGHGAPMRRLIGCGAVPGHRFVQIGLRGYWPPADVLEWMAARNMHSYSMDQVESRGMDAVLDEAVALVTEPDDTGAVDGIFLSIDIDVVDPGMAPATGTPEPGGLTSRQLLEAVRRLTRELPVVGVDLVEVAPHYDQPMNITALLANRVVLEALTGMAQRRKLGR